jgi:MFS family permease
VLHWSRLSDVVGRKPIILVGLFGLSLSMFSFGLSTTYWGAAFWYVSILTVKPLSHLITYPSRTLNGALNGNVGIIKSIVAEITDPTNIPQVYAYMPIAWSLGGALG